MIHLLLFDLNGVLCTEGLTSGIKKYEHEYAISEGEFYKIVHDFQGWKDFTLGYIREAEYLRMCQQRAVAKHYPFHPEKFIEYIEEMTIPNIELIEYIHELLQKYIIGIVSNSPKEWFDKFVKRTNLESVVTIKAISSYVHVRKPDTKIFQIALDQAHVEASEAVYIDDRVDMVQGAQELGIQTIKFDGNIRELKNIFNR